jgi:drug/metabolite transporter (DMT)-like permease
VKYLDLFLGAVFFVLGAMAVNRATRAAEPRAARRDWIGAVLCTVAGLIFTCLYIFSSPTGAGDAPGQAQEARP